jgi:hypothetical protein
VMFGTNTYQYVQGTFPSGFNVLKVLGSPAINFGKFN